MRNSYSNCSGGADRAPYAVDNKIKNLKKGPRNCFFNIGVATDEKMIREFFKVRENSGNFIWSQRKLIKENKI